jgi:hypothetical protein
VGLGSGEEGFGEGPEVIVGSGCIATDIGLVVSEYEINDRLFQ